MTSRSRWRQRMLLAPLLVLIFQQIVYIRVSFRPVSYPPPKEGNKFALIPPEPNGTASNLSLSYNQITNVVIAPIQNSKHKDAGSYYDSILSPSGHLRCWNPRLRCQILREANATSEDAVRITDSANDTSITGPKSLALVDPMLQDGYRNQFMRFVALTVYALINGFDQMLLPSIRWKCKHTGISTISVPFEVLFDVDVWNNHTELPRLARYNESEHFDWDPFTGLFRGACDVLDTYLYGGRETKDVIMNRTSHYRHPTAYGGGRWLGNLFVGYLQYDSRRPTFNLNEQNVTFLDLEATITRAMKPSAAMERLVKASLGENGQYPYIALHARFEPDMLVHTKCKSVKVYNMTDVFGMIRQTDHSNATNLSLYIAINMKDFNVKNPYKYFQTERKLNKAALDAVAAHGLDLPSGKKMTVSISGQSASKSREIDLCANEIVASMVSFEIAVRAEKFIGTYVSSWSTTVWKTRYYQGKGENYVYTPTGLHKIEGVPQPFRC